MKDMQYDLEQLKTVKKDNADLKDKIQNLSKSETFWQNKLDQER